MKEQKELIEAALALVDVLEGRAWFEFTEEARLTNAVKAYRQAQEQPEALEEKHYLQYSVFSCKVSWCPECREHFYNERNETHTTEATEDHYHIYRPQTSRRKAPWKDSEGNELFDGDEVRFPDGETLTLEYRQRDDWGARNSDGVWLPIGFLLTERAVKVSP